jgi:hypothetical protein
MQDNLPAPYVCPISGGSFQLEWISADRHLEIEFLDGSRTAFLQEERGNIIDSDEVPLARMDKITKLLEWFISG